MYTYQIDEIRALITFQGDLDNEQIRQAYEEVTRDPSFRPGSQVLVDDLESSYDPSMAEAQSLVEIFSSFSDRIAQFAIVVRKDVHFGLGRMVEVYCESQGVNLRIFRDVEDARAWLDSTRG
jgi:hypothetical protein